MVTKRPKMQGSEKIENISTGVQGGGEWTEVICLKRASVKRVEDLRVPYNVTCLD